MTDLAFIKKLQLKMQDKTIQLFASILVLILVTACLGTIMNRDSHRGGQKPENPESLDNQSIDTYIPKGHILVPIEILNKEAIQGIIEGKGIVNLYSAKKKKIAQNVKVIQAPLNKDIFAVLVRDSEAAPILENASGVFVTINSGKILETSEVLTEKRRATQVNFGG